MHLLDRLLWTGTRAWPAVGRPPWLVGAVPQAERGILDLATVAGPALTPEAVPQEIHDFYAAPERSVMRVRPRWTPPLQLAGALWSGLFARRWGQLALPLSEIARIDGEVERDDGRVVWRRQRPDGSALYVSGCDVVQPPDEAAPCVRMTFDVPGGALIAVFAARWTDDGRFVLATGPGGPGARGLYALPEDGPARYVSALREALALRVVDEAIVAEHTLRWWGLPVVVLTYTVSESASASSAGRAR